MYSLLRIMICILLVSCSSNTFGQACDAPKLIDPDGADRDGFGYSIAVDDDVAIVGAPFDDEDVNASGAAFVFRFNAKISQWEMEQKLLPSDPGASNFFGLCVAIKGDYAIVGAPNASYTSRPGAAYVFRFNGSSWIEEQKLGSDSSTEQNYGISVSISEEVAIVGALSDENDLDSACCTLCSNIFLLCNGWFCPIVCDKTDLVPLPPGTTIAPPGVAYVYRFNHQSAEWIEEAQLLPPDPDPTFNEGFGTVVLVNNDVAIIGAPFDKNDVSATRPGAAYVYRYNGVSWGPEQKITASDGDDLDAFGASLALYGDVMLVSAIGDDDNGASSGSAYVFRYNGSDWFQEAKLLAFDGEEDDFFGYTMGVKDGLAIVGMYGLDPGTSDPASAYVFEFSSELSGWLETQVIPTPTGAAGDAFARTLALNQHTAFIGAYLDSNNGISAGAVYVIDLPVSYCPADLNCDQIVNIDDLIMLIGVWGPNTVPADLDNNGQVNVDDLLLLIGAWGPCP